MLTFEISDRITVRLNQNEVDDDYFIEGITHDWSKNTQNLVTRWNLSEASRWLYTPDPLDMTLRPNAVGTTTENDPFPNGGEDNYEDVDDVTPDEDTTYVTAPQNSSSLDTYGVPDSGLVTGTINSVTVYARVKKTNAASGLNARAAVRVGGADYYGSSISLGTSYALESKEWTVSPDTSAAWTWAEIDAMEIGIELFSLPEAFNNYGRCTQVYAVVNYTPSW